ncbi:L-threonate dehydrogenase [Lichenifustis flavocetrariae]|uniref:L-threonate dehydrogenase n=1 Tax=Lichenifustis flavocetrariae TaxID=2949735 RepID=A0AA41YSY7_9HYPH|nr:L-threonate dehydrogenase [Lichenifustis flavocetrariae]MCW6506626.1 NAD(P)-dependent oxidoreductase [Lichenifustis flavocetrariae]
MVRSKNKQMQDIMQQGGPQSAVIGLGSMGLGMARSLLQAMPVVGFDRDVAAVERFIADGGRGAASVMEAAQGASILVLVVVNAAQTEAVLFGEAGTQGAAAQLAKGGVIISCATMAPDDARRLASRCAEHGLHYLDAPISGGAARAASGELTVMASGTPDAFAAAQSALDAMAKTVYRLGDEAGIGASFKIVNQLLAGVHIAAACEAITLAKRLGLDLEKVYEVITAAAGNSWMFENRIPHVLKGDYRPASAVDIFTKDLGIVADIGRSTKFPTPIAASALQMFLMTSAAGMGRDDDSSVARLIAQIAGLDLPGQAKT